MIRAYLLKLELFYYIKISKIFHFYMANSKIVIKITFENLGFPKSYSD